jgi:hypothetical protein
MANAFCERLIGTFRRECLDWVIPFGENHPPTDFTRMDDSLKPRTTTHVARTWISEQSEAKVLASVHRHKLPKGYCITAKVILGGLYHEYSLEKEAA